MNLINIIGISAGILTSISMLPQLIKIIKEKEAENVSVVMIIVLTTGLALWVTYGIMKDDWPLIITNCFSILVNLTTLFFRVRYNGIKESGDK